MGDNRKLTLQEALNDRIPRIRLARWGDPRDYLRLPLLPNGMQGPWIELYADRCQEALNIRPGSQRLPTFQSCFEGDDFEVYTGPVSPHEVDSESFARCYLES